MTQSRFGWLRRAWDFFTGYRDIAPASPPPPASLGHTAFPPNVTPLGEDAALYGDGVRGPTVLDAAFYGIGAAGLAVLSVEQFEDAPQANQEALLRVRVSNVGPETQDFGQVMLYWHDGIGCDNAPIARQRALAIPPMPAGGSAVFTTRLHVPLTVEGEVAALLVPMDGDGEPWEPKAERLVLRRFVAGVGAPMMLEAA